jgi:ADP-glucose pyrophosphorylase
VVVGKSQRILKVIIRREIKVDDPRKVRAAKSNNDNNQRQEVGLSTALVVMEMRQ